MKDSFPKLASRAKLQTDPATGKPALLYPEGVLLLNDSAAAILELCDGSRETGEIILDLCERFRAPEPALRRDVDECLSGLRAKGLVEVSGNREEAGPRKADSGTRTQGRPAGANPAYRPFGLLAELTYQCPLHCPYCSNPTVIRKNSTELTTGEWKRVLGEAWSMGVLHVLFSGGEPLQRTDMEELVAEAGRLGLYSNLITSALGFSKERGRKLKEAGLDSIQISFQSSEPGLADEIAGTKAHQRKLEAAGIARDLGLPLTVNVVLHRANIGQVEALVQMAEGLGAHRLELANTQYYGWAFQNQNALLPTREQVEKAAQEGARARARLKGKMDVIYVIPDYYSTRPKPCMNGWGKRYLTVNPLGDVLPCPTSGGIPGLTFENIRYKSLDWIWRESEAFNRFRGTEWLPEPCKSCPEKEADFGGCRCQAALLTGDGAKTDPACELSPDRGRLAERVAAAQGRKPEPEKYQYRVNPSNA